MTNRVLLVLLGLLPVVSTLAQDMPQGKQVYSSDFVIDEIPRRISFYLPENYGSKDFYPLLIVLPGKKESGNNFIKNYGDELHTSADSAGCVILYPEALASGWHTGSKDSVNDAGFISIMITYFTQQYRCNPNNIYAAGFETGADMAYRLACNYPHIMTAIAAIGAQQKCTVPENVKVMEFTSAIPGNSKTAYSKALLAGFDFLMKQNR
ncbi:alpha/beta hydrolase family esterase [Foetidibacter luteolus]|uniref:alpha/beta hydrolase family esterase n=1 Tax=Foetidibacter luteolus TaxID=2608880 RepID=UPI00129AD420|nr:PHB depolymerase family esterase [Foetidibacter luteolus]